MAAATVSVVLCSRTLTKLRNSIVTVHHCGRSSCLFLTLLFSCPPHMPPASLPSLRLLLALSQGQGTVDSGFVIPDVTKKGKGKGKKGKRAAATAAEAGSGVGAAADAAVVGRGSANAAVVTGPGGDAGGAAGGGGFQKKARPPAKYLNSPETTLFKKGKNIFGLDLAKEVCDSRFECVCL